jgi:hypothetical protein
MKIVGKGQDFKHLKHLEYWFDKEIDENQFYLLSDFKIFLTVVWKFLGLPRPTRTQMEIADFLQFGYTPNLEEQPLKWTDRKLITGYRGMAKSFITTAFAVWCLMRNPYQNVLVLSATSSRADAFVKGCKDLIRGIKMLHFLKPKDRKSGQRDKAFEFDVGPAKKGEQSASLKAVGIFGTMTGFRGDIIIADDVETEGTSLTATMRERLSERVKELDNLLKPAKTNPLRQIIFLGTPQHQDSLYMKLPKRGFKRRIWTAYYPVDEQRQELWEFLSPQIRNDIEIDPENEKYKENYGLHGKYGAPTDTERFDEEELSGKELSLGAGTFAREYQMDISVSMNDFPLRIADLIVDDLDMFQGYSNYIKTKMSENILEDLQVYNPSQIISERFYRAGSKSTEVFPYDYKILVFDPAGSGTDESAYSIIATLNGQLYILEVGGFLEAGYERESIDFISKLAIKHKVNAVVVETNGVGQSFPTIIQQAIKEEIAKQKIFNMAIGIEPIYHTTNKEKRIIKYLESNLSMGKIIISKDAIEKDVTSNYKNIGEDEAHMYSFLYQLTRMQDRRDALTHDDRIDCVAMGIEFLDTWIGRQENQALAHKIEERMKQEAHDWINDQHCEWSDGFKPDIGNGNSFRGNYRN